MDVLLDGLYELYVFFGGVRVVHPQIAQPCKLLGCAEVDDQGLAVADVQIAVGLRREPGVDGLPGELAAGGDILFDKGMDEIFAFGDLSHIDSFLSCGEYTIMHYYKRLQEKKQSKTWKTAQIWTYVKKEERLFSKDYEIISNSEIF